MVADESRDDPTKSFVALTSGTMVSHYRIIERIGAGGMGEVYLAEDTKLDRKVALKFLPQHLCQDADCRARFTREAQAAAKLDHPNIVAVHEVGVHQGRPFFSMQHVEGQTLKEALAGKALPLDWILEISIQVCDGLQAAHEQGVTHRDIKPSNVLIDSHGRARIVDFGLASIMGTDHLTKTGSTLGTIGYMSPEQVRGETVDNRTDLFSLGVVLYELITGHSPFKSDPEAATLHAITDTNPEPLARFRREVPPELQTIIDKALDKKVTTRYQHADELQADLLRLYQQISGQRSAVSFGLVSKRSRVPVYILLGFVVISVSAVAVLLLFKGKEHGTAQPEFRKITSTGDAYFGVISPDGTSYAYSRVTDSGSFKLTVYVSDIESGQPIPVFHGPEAQAICWSPNGKELLIRGRQKNDDSALVVFLVPRLGGKPRRYSVPGSVDGWDLAWLPDGKQFVSLCTNRLIFVDRESGDTTTIPFDQEFIHTFIGDFSPDGRWLVFCGAGKVSGLWLFDSIEKSTHHLCDAPITQDVTWSPLGNAIYATDGGTRLLRFDVDSKSGELRGEPEVLLSGIPMTVGLSISNDGRRLLWRQYTAVSNLRKVVLGAKSNPAAPTSIPLTSGTAMIVSPSISPDGRFVSYMGEVGGRLQAFKASVDGGEAVQVTNSHGHNQLSCWSPDSRQLAVLGFDNGLAQWTLSVVGPDGESVPKVIASGPFTAAVSLWLDWSAKDRIVAGFDADRILFVNPLTGDAKWQQFDCLHSKVWCPRLSPDGRRMALSPEHEILVYSFADSSQTVLTRAQADVLALGWSHDGKWIYYVAGGGVIAKINLESKRIVTLANLAEMDWTSYVHGVTVSHDGTFAIHEVRRVYRDIYLIENFDPHVK